MKKGFKALLVLSFGLLLFSCKKKTTKSTTTKTTTTKPKTSTITEKKVNRYAVNASLSDNAAGTVSGAGFYSENDEVTLTATENIGYSFLGWYVGDEKKTGYYEYNFIITENVDFIAKYEKVELKECSVVFDDDCGNPNASQTLLQGEKLYEPILPVKEGHTFLGWYYENVKWDFNKDVVSRSFTLKAKWSVNEYNLTLTTNLEEAGTISDSNTYLYNEEIELENNTYLGYDFLGWYINDEKLESNTINMPSSDLTIEARFKVDDNMSNLIFTSDSTRCDVTGIKNKNVNSIVVPDYVTSISKGAFCGCSVLSKITLPFIGYGEELDDELCRSTFGYIFGEESYLNSIEARGWSYFCPEDDVIIDNMVTYYLPTCLEEVVITKQTSIIDSAFYGCSELKKVVLPDNVDYLGRLLFCECTSLEQAVLPKNISYIPEGTFFSCTNLATVNIPENITKIHNGAFSGCEKLRNVTLPDSLISIGDSAFYACIYFTKITIPNNVISIGRGAFGMCTCQINWGNNPKISSLSGGSFQYYKGSSFTIPYGVKTIGRDAFESCTNIESITIPTSVTKIEFRAFYNCSKLTSINIPKNVMEIEARAFMDCHLLSSITVDSENQYYDSRNNCNAIISNNDELIVGCKNTIIPSSVRYIGEYAFFSCDGLTTITIPSQVYSIGKYAFGDCRDLEKVTISDGVKAIREYAFMYCESLKELTIPNSVTTIGGAILYNCGSIKRLTLPFIGESENNNSSNKYAIGYLFGSEYAGSGFEQIYQNYHTFFIPISLEEVVITKASYLQYGVFENCSHITKVVLPSTLTEIADNAFIKSSINKIYYMGNPGSFSQVTVGTTGNTCVNTDNIYYYSETNPGTSGNYWHYDSDGYTIKEWQ